MLYIAQEDIMKLLNDYNRIAFESRYQANKGEGIKILMPKQRLQSLPITLAKVKVSNLLIRND